MSNKIAENKQLYIFLIVHFIVWSCIGLIRLVLPTDTLEGIYWGSICNFGTPKHPPLAAWITYNVYNFFKCDFCIYLLSQLFITCGFVYIYKLAKYFLDSKKAILSVIILEGCWIYAYITGYYGFNPDVVLLLTLPAITYYFYKCTIENKFINWLMLGLTTGISFMDKYQTVFLIVGMFIWTAIFRRDIFKNKYFYFSIILALLIFAPHIVWLYKYDFFPMLYYSEKLTTIDWYNHITSPLNFLAMQFVIMAGSLIIFLSTFFRYRHSLKVNKSDKKFWFLIILTFTPLAIHLLLAIFTGSNMRPQWNYVFLYMIGILLFYLLNEEIANNEFKFVRNFSYVIMFIIFLSFGTMLTVEKNYRSRYPVDKVLNDFQNIWSREHNTSLKYVGGFHEFTFPLTIYGKTHPINIMDTFGYKNIWINEDDLKKSGAFIVSRQASEVIAFTKCSCPYLTDDFVVEPKEYKFIVHNALKMPREYIIYYFIVHPNKLIRRST